MKEVWNDDPNPRTKIPMGNSYMDQVIALPPGGDRSFNACLVLVDRYRKKTIFLPFNKEDTAIMIWNRVISNAGSFQNIKNNRDTKLTSPLWTNIHNVFGANLLLSTAYHPQADDLVERMLQTLEEMIIRFQLPVLEFKISDSFTNYLCTLIPALELAYKTAVYSSTGKTPGILKKGLNPRLPYDTLKKELVDIHPIAIRFKIMLEKEIHNANRCMQDSFNYAKERRYKFCKPHDFKLVRLGLRLNSKLY
ncbi:hypothetical protein O181_025107 [Austropuccinia psidii MF-1]|uniref:Integrase catalytic domain-containing protein n=1 Tax=Austropuccinia psidii MF-1 TaxID=1389203 RepID=A0A9Q3CKJ0_9BASI|nr:hypothetical protein [Austropuccinia psidii MF-1]